MKSTSFSSAAFIKYALSGLALAVSVSSASASSAGNFAIWGPYIEEVLASTDYEYVAFLINSPGTSENDRVQTLPKSQYVMITNARDPNAQFCLSMARQSVLNKGKTNFQILLSGNKVTLPQPPKTPTGKYPSNDTIGLELKACILR